MLPSNMITKILLTAFIILAALTFIRYKNSQSRVQEQVRQAELAADRRTAMLVAIALVVLTLMVSGGIYYWHWQDEHRIFTVQVINSHTGLEQSYHVYQSEIDGRRFRTTEGRLINLSDSERMEVMEGVVANDTGAQ